MKEQGQENKGEFFPSTSIFWDIIFGVLGWALAWLKQLLFNSLKHVFFFLNRGSNAPIADRRLEYCLLHLLVSTQSNYFLCYPTKLREKPSSHELYFPVVSGLFPFTKLLSTKFNILVKKIIFHNQSQVYLKKMRWIHENEKKSLGWIMIKIGFAVEFRQFQKQLFLSLGTFTSCWK